MLLVVQIWISRAFTASAFWGGPSLPSKGIWIPPLKGFIQMNHRFAFAFRKITVPAAWRMGWRGVICESAGF